jgi:predicted RNase H-like HicB family nuclease
MKKSTYKAVVQRDGKWWIGWIEEIPGVNAQARTKPQLLRDLRSALKEALAMNREEAIASAAQGFQEVSIEL